MLSRPATKLSLNADDIAAYEQRKATRDAVMKSDAMDDSKTSSQEGTDVLPAAAAKTAKAKMSREQRIGVGSSRG